MSNKIKEKLSEKPKKFTLDGFEEAYVKELSILLQFHIYKREVINNFLTYVAKQRLGYGNIKEGHVLLFDVDPKDDKTITITETKFPTEDSKESK